MIGKKIVLLSAIVFSALGLSVTASAGDLHENYGEGVTFESSYDVKKSDAFEPGRR